MAVPARPSDMGKYNFTKDQESLDWFNIMTYDFHGSWDIKTGHHTNLFTPDTNRMSPAECSFDKAVRFIRDSLHVLPKKIMPGVAFYGKGWKHVSPVNGGLFQQGSPADGRFESSTNNYCDLLPMIQAGAELHHDDLAMASWLYNPKDSTFWTYDDAQSVALKARYSSAYNLRGIMTWEISGDDSLGTLTKVLASGNMPGDPVKSKGKAKKDAGLFLSQPKADQIFKAGTDIILKANTGKAKFSKIEFFGDGKSLGYTTQMPGSWVWFNVPAGTHTIKLFVTDEHGNSVLPEPGSVTIRVTHP
jgi:GH18 family chitinase